MFKFFWKINLINLNSCSLKKLIHFLNIKTFKYKEILLFLYKKDITDFTFVNFSNKIFLSFISFVKILNIKKQLISKDNTIKFILTLDNNKNIETVLIPNRKNHFTLCISSQSGCILNCSFCHTGKFKFDKNLKQYEIISQVILGQKILTNLFTNKLITNIVFMGMGEPLFNINNLLSALNIISNLYAFNISKNKITVSTSGIIDKFFLIKKAKIRLALSLHASNNLLRTKLMNINKKYSINDLIKRCEIFTKKNSFTIEYIMIKNVNDSINDAIILSELVKKLKCKICLIPFNNFTNSNYSSATKKQIRNFKKKLIDNNITTTIRKSMGNDIYGACGQLSGII